MHQSKRALNSKVDRWLLGLYILIVIIYIFEGYDVTWMYWASTLFTRILVCIVSILMIAKLSNNIKKKYVPPLIFLFLYSIYSIVFSHSGIRFVEIRYIALFLSMSTAILLPADAKRLLLRYITSCFVFILTISLVAWILFLVGVPLPHSDIIHHANGFHEYYNYYLFRVNASYENSILPRFSSIFLEPGQMASPCCFLIFLNVQNNRVLTYSNGILLLSIILSFSLISWGLLIITLVSTSWFKGSKYRFLYTFTAIFAIGGLYMFFSEAENSAVNNLILSRLESDNERIIAGNNRTSYYFDTQYKSYIQTDSKWFGIHNTLSSGYDWTNNSSGIKKVIVHEGIIGLIIFVSFILSLYTPNRSSLTTIFLIMLLLAYFVRNLLQNPMWMIMAIIGMYVLKEGIQTFNKDNLQRGGG